MELRPYRSLLSACNLTTAYRNPRTFDLAERTEDEKRRLGELGGLEAAFDAKSLRANEQFDVLLEGLLCNGPGSAITYVHEHRALPQSKLRSRKGVFFGKKHILAGRCIQVEDTGEDGDSVLAGIAVMSKANFKECLGFLTQSFRSFAVYCPEHDVFSKEWLLENIRRRTIRAAWVEVDYARVVLDLCRGQQAVVRLALEDDTPAFQLFVPTVLLDSLAAKLTRLARDSGL